jgi:hypothetical protein
MNISGNSGYLGFNERKSALQTLIARYQGRPKGCRTTGLQGIPGGTKGEDGGVPLRQRLAAVETKEVRLCG